MRCMWALLAGGSLLLPPSAAPGAEPLPAARLIPASSDSVQHAGDPALYRGDELYNYIDGGAPQYIEYGFAEVASQEILFRERTYIFDVYRMADDLAAFGIYSVRKPRQSVPLPGFPYGSVTAYQVLLAHGPYLIEIAAYEPIPESAGDVSVLARLGTSAFDPPASAADLAARAPFTKLPASDRIRGTERLARGPVSLRSALGAAASDPLLAAIDAAAGSAPEELGAAPVWLIAGYHPREKDGALEPATTLVILADALAQEQGGISTPPEGPSLAVMRRGNDLLFCSSRIEPQAFRVWVEQVLAASP